MSLLHLIVIAALCCISLAGEVRAQTIWTWSDIQFNGCTGLDPSKICGTASMQIDYSTQVYYNLQLDVNLTDINMWPSNYDVQRYSALDSTYLSGAAEVNYYSTNEYETEAFPTVDIAFRSEDGAYLDHYNYGIYLDGEPVLWPGAAGSYGFNGPGPEIRLNFINIGLGTLSSLASRGVRHGSPHHVKVVSDNTFDDCGSKKRQIRFQVVDRDGNRAGDINVQEHFYRIIELVSVYNSCRDEQTYPSRCAPTDRGTRGIFGDQLWVGCPNPTAPADCGYEELTAQWRWCPRDRTHVNITTNRYNVRRNSVLINGVARYDTGTHL